MARAEAMRLGLAVTAIAVTVLESAGLGVAPHGRHPRIEHAFEARRSVGLWRNVVAESQIPWAGSMLVRSFTSEAVHLAGLPFAYTPPARL